MKSPNKRKLQQIAFNHSTHIDFQDFVSFYKKCTTKPCFLVIDASIPSDKPLQFRKSLLEKM